MIIDSSAVLAVLFGEADAETYEKGIATASPCRMSVANVLETSIVVESRGGAAAGHELDVFLERAGIELIPVTIEHLEAARLLELSSFFSTPSHSKIVQPRGSPARTHS